MVDLLYLVARCVLTVVFLVAGITKLIDQRGARKNLMDFGVPPVVAGPGGLLLPVAELVVAVALATWGSARWGAIGATVLLIVFTGAALYNLAKGRRPDCRCFGQVRPKPIGLSTIIRNLVLMIIAIALVQRGETVSGLHVLANTGPMIPPGSWPIVVVGLPLALLVVLEGWFILQLLQQNGRLMARLEAVEARLGINPNSSEPTEPLQTGLPPGTDAPVFSLPDLDGHVHSLDSILQSGKPGLLIFSNPGCPACEALTLDLSKWMASHPHLNVVVVSHGSADVNRKQFEASSRPLILLQKNAEVEAAYGVQMTPSAVIVDEQGKITDWLAVGARAVRALLSRYAS